jgi:hypothetical protein
MIYTWLDLVSLTNRYIRAGNRYLPSCSDRLIQMTMNELLYGKLKIPFRYTCSTKLQYKSTLEVKIQPDLPAMIKKIRESKTN